MKYWVYTPQNVWMIKLINDAIALINWEKSYWLNECSHWIINEWPNTLIR